jgi:hypothetical protein
MPQQTTIELLREDLNQLERQLVALVSISPVSWRNRDAGMFTIVGGPDYYFDKPSQHQLRLQLPLKSAYDMWFERFRLLFRSPPSQIEKRIKDAHEKMVAWIDLGPNYKISQSSEGNVRAARESFRPFHEFLSLHSGISEVILIPDTNVLTASPDPLSYKGIAESATFTFLLLPTVLSELDNLKIFARDPAYREKVAKVIRRIKGWRKQGSLSQGTTLHKTITVLAVAREPDVRGTLSWLDPENHDDRIIASALEIQAAAPTAAITLVTSDINLQNKAEAAKLPYSEAP